MVVDSSVTPVSIELNLAIACLELFWYSDFCSFCAVVYCCTLVATDPYLDEENLLKTAFSFEFSSIFLRRTCWYISLAQDLSVLSWR